MLRLFETCIYKAHRSEKRGVLWLASYPVRCDWLNTSNMKRKCYAPLPYCDGISRWDERKKIKPIIYVAFVASRGDIITVYNDLYGILALRCIALRKHFHVCICDRRNDTQALLYTAQNYSVWIVSDKFFKYENILTPDCPCKVGIAPLYKNSLCA